MKRFIILAAATVIGIAGAQAEVKLSPKNIDKVVKQLTLEEKANLLVGYTFGDSYWGLPTNPDPNAGAIVLGAAGNTAEVERLGIPHTVLADGPAGVHISAERPGEEGTFYASGFMTGTALSSTWNTELVKNMGAAMGNEAREYGVDCLLGPGMNIMRNPLCGRNFEYYSEDPFLTGLIAAAMIDGIQSEGVAVSAKHFAANNQETNRFNNNSILSQRTLREIYLKGFEIAVRKSNPWTIMSSYNKINGTYTQESYELLETILRDEWGFKNIVMSDWTHTRNTAAQVHAGNDLLAPGNAEQIEQIISGVKDGTIAMADVDRNVKRILEYVVKTHRFKGDAYSNKPDLVAHAALIRQSAPEGMILLKNDNVLPFRSEKRLALLGKTSYALYAGGSGSGDVNKPYTIDLLAGLGNAGFLIDDTLRTVYERYNAFAKDEAEAEMGEFTTNGYFPRPRVVEPTLGVYTYRHAAKRADVAIVTIGRSCGEGCDREMADFHMNPDEIELLRNTSEAFHAAGKKVVVIINVGAAVETASIRDYADAILLVWQPGMEAGNSIADVLSGKTYPSGKLPMTWPEKIEDVPSTACFPHDVNWRDDIFMERSEFNALPYVLATPYKEEWKVGYRDPETANVAYPFGYGLSYTSYAYSNAKVQRKGSNYIATITVTNTGSMPGKETVQLYVTAPQSTMEKPAMELKAFAKTRELQPGESCTLTMNFSNYDLASYDEAQQAFVTDAGTYTARFASDVMTVRENVEFKAQKQVVKCHNVLAK